MKAVVWVWVEVVRLCRLMAAADGLIHSVAVAKMKTALEVSTIICKHTHKHNIKTSHLKVDLL